LKRIVRLAVIAAVAGIGLGASGVALASHQDPGYSPCRGAANGEDRLGYEDTADPNDPRHELPTVYTDHGQTYAGVCGANGYVQVNNVQGAVAGNNALIEGRTGNDRVDAMIWGNGRDSYGPASVWVSGGGPASTTPGCAPAGDDTYVYGNGNNVTRELPTVYTDGGATHTGVCGGGAYVQVDNAAGALAGDNALVEGRTGNETVDSKVWGNGTSSYGPATVWVAGGGPAGTAPSCAHDGDARYGHANGNNVTRELPTVYTDGSSHTGVCGGGGRAEARNLGNAANDPAGSVVVEGLPTP
jgi:hypothetical protein